jgi:hypothetical protein
MVPMEFFIDITLPAAIWQYEYQEYLLGGKGVKDGRCVGLTTLPPSCANCHEVWEPQPPGTLSTSPDLNTDSFT